MGLTARDSWGSGSAAGRPCGRSANGVYQEWTEAASTGRDFTSEYRFLSKAGKTTWVRGYGAAIPDLAGNVTGYVGVVVDSPSIPSSSRRSPSRPASRRWTWSPASRTG